MYSMDNLLHLAHSDGADELRLHVGEPPVVVLDGEAQPIDGPVIEAEEAELLLQSITDTRQRRELREHRAVEFLCRFREFKGCEIHLLKNKEAIDLFNRLKRSGRRVAIHYHSTC